MKRKSHFRSLASAIRCDFLEQRRMLANISGTTYWDANNNNAPDFGESTLSGATVFTDLNNNGVLDGGEKSAISGGSGNYTIFSVPGGTYNLREIAPANYFSTFVRSVTVSGDMAGQSMFNAATLYFGGPFNESDGALLHRNAGGTQYEIITPGTTYEVPLNIPSLRFELAGGDDSLTVDYANGNPIPAGGVLYNGGAQTNGDSLVVSGTNSADTFTLTNNTVSNNGTISYGTTESVTINCLAANDTVNVNSQAVPLSINGGANNDTFNIASGSIYSTNTTITINGDGGPGAGTADAIVVNDSASASSNASYGFSAGSFTRYDASCTVNYSNVESFALSGESGNSDYQISSMSSGTSMAFNDPGGNDNFRVGFLNSGLLAGSVSINAGPGADIVTLNDEFAGNDAYTIDGSLITRPNLQITQTNAETVRIFAETGNNNFYVPGTSASTSLVIYDQDGSNTFAFGNGDLGDLAGPITVYGNGDSASFNDGAILDNATYAIDITPDGGAVARTGFGGLTYQGIAAVSITGATGNNTYNLNATVGTWNITDNGGDDTFNLGTGTMDRLGGSITLNGGTGSDGINLQDYSVAHADTYNILPTTIDRNFTHVTYSNFESVVVYGEPGDNVYNIATSTFVPVYLFDTSGSDTINTIETQFGGPVFVFPSAGDDAVGVNTDNAGGAFTVLVNSQRVGPIDIGVGGYAQLYAGVGTAVTATSVFINGGDLDVTDGAMIVDYGSKSPLDTITSYLASGYANGTWNGPGIISSSAAIAASSATRKAVGYAEAWQLFNSFPAGFAGQNVDNTSVVMRYTLSGDANMDKKVDLTDFTFLASNFNKTGGWLQGDFNYDNAVDLTDFTFLAANFNQILPSQPPRSATSTSTAAMPSTLALSSAGGSSDRNLFSNEALIEEIAMT
jgi:hypothetical protein